MTLSTSSIKIAKSSVNHRACARACQIFRRIKNQSLYLIKNVRKEDDKYLTATNVDQWIKENNSELYGRLPAAIAQRAVLTVANSVSSYFAAMAEYKIAPHKFKAEPQFPRYHYKAATVMIGRNGFSIKAGVLNLPKQLGIKPLQLPFKISQPHNSKPSETWVKEVRLVPKGNHFEVQITHESALTDRLNFSPLLDKSRACGIDLGINNLLTLVTNQPDVSPVLIKGGSLKSINAKYNKDAGELRSNEKFAHLKARGARRHRQVSDILHKASRAVIDFCLNNDLGTLVIGKNKDFKQNINIGRVNNQKFVSIPHARLIDLIVYKASKQNIKVTVREESYTSKASSLDFDEIPSYSAGVKNKLKFSGKRVKRGLYKTRDALLNADVNGALNILRKELGDASLSLIDKGCVTQPRTLYCQNAREPRIALC